MFSKASKTPTTNGANGARPNAKSGVPSIISADLRIVGDLVCDSDIQIDGTVEGDIHSRNVVIGEGATVTGSLKAETVQVCGKLIGQIRADTVVLEKTAHVTGDILHHALAIAQGAYIEGACKRLDSAGNGDGKAAGEKTGKPAGKTVDGKAADALDKAPEDKSKSEKSETLQAANNS
ncbi:MAG: polymer-forming cytoskeletal protein [Dongiaceae bacterium]